MKGIAITNAEDVSLLEIKELTEEKGRKEETVVIFNATSKKLCDLCYHGRSFKRILELICSFEFKDLEGIKKKIKMDGFEAETFAVRCIREGKHDFSSADVERIVGEKVNSKVDLKNPQKVLLAYVYNNRFYLGVDYAGFDLGKRDYKIFPHPASIRGDVAYSLLRIAGFEKNDVLVDPFCGSGTIAIEAALFCLNKSVHFYGKEKFAFLKFLNYEFADKLEKGKCRIFGTDSSQNAIIAARKNAKIAGADVELSTADVEWLDTKFSEKSIDRIVTNPPQLSKRSDAVKVKKAYGDLFNNAKYALKPKGTVAVITRNAEVVKEIAKKNNFKVKKEIALGELGILVLAQ